MAAHQVPRPWDSPGKNTGVGCHFLLQCMKVKSESEVAQSCLTLSDPMDCSPPGSSIHGIFQARVLEWGAMAFSKPWMLSVSKYTSNVFQVWGLVPSIVKACVLHLERKKIKTLQRISFILTCQNSGTLSKAQDWHLITVLIIKGHFVLSTQHM